MSDNNIKQVECPRCFGNHSGKDCPLKPLSVSPPAQDVKPKSITDMATRILDVMEEYAQSVHSYQITRAEKAEAELSRVKLERDEALKQLSNQQGECHTIRRNYLHEKSLKVAAREALKLAAARFHLAFISEETIACDVWEAEALAALNSGDTNED